MGVPSLFRTLFKKHPDIVSKNVNNIDNLFLDFNCVIHNSKCISHLDLQVIDEVINQTANIITKISPSKMVYIAIDGPVPMGKLVKQRERRYKKIYDDYNVQCIYHKFNQPIPHFFDSNKISPGTLFMETLHNKMKEAIESNRFGDLQIILDDSNEKGEGEFKIFNYIRSHQQTKGTSCIFSMDADIIILSMMIRKSNIFILRQDCENGNQFIDINQLKKQIVHMINNKCEYPQRIINDVCFLSLLGGNDFVQPIIQFKIRDSGWDNIISIYFKNITLSAGSSKNCIKIPITIKIYKINCTISYSY